MKKPHLRLSRRTQALGVAACAGLVVAGLAATGGTPASATDSTATATPIKHLVVIYGENVSYDHYFGTYPTADGFEAKASTPKNDNLVSAGLVDSSQQATGKDPNSVQPFLLTSDQAVTCDQNHAYKPEQQAVNGGAMDKFVESVSTNAACNSSTLYGVDGETMGFYDGTTTTAMWNYAQNYAMSDNSWDATFGPSTPGAMNLISGQTHGVISYAAAGVGADGTTPDASNTSTDPVRLTTPDSYTVQDPDDDGVGSVTADPDPVYDDCNNNSHANAYAVGGMQSSNKNIGDLLNEKNVTWGWFQGGFSPSKAYNASTGAPAVCGNSHVNVNGAASVDYSPHHNPFQYYKSTSNPHHLPPTKGIAIGGDDPDGANHQYGLGVFHSAVASGNLPAVSFVKAAEYQDGHAAYSDPIDEQHFITHVVNELEQGPEWSSTAIVLAYDDSDGWYDHVAPTIINGSASATNDLAQCTTAAGVAATAPLGADGSHDLTGGYLDRCGPSQRLPMVVISPYARNDYVSHTETAQPSITRFIEDNWLGKQRIGDGSFDAVYGSIDDMFDFKDAPRTGKLILDSDGRVESNGSSYATRLMAKAGKVAKTGKVKITVTVSPKSATGAVKAKNGSRSLGSKRLSGGKATFTVRLEPGQNKLSFSYARADNYAPASAKLTVKYVKPAKHKKKHRR